MCERCGNPECPGPQVLVEELSKMKDSDVVALLTQFVGDLRKQVPRDHEAYKTVLVTQALVDEMTVRFAELAVRAAFGLAGHPLRAPALPSLLSGAALGGLLGMAGGRAFQRDVTPRRGARSRGPNGKVQRRFGPPREKKS